MIYAPVIIPTLCRAEKLKNCIESLQKNSYAKYTELYIGLDYPPNEKYRQGYEQIKEYLNGGIEGFARVEIIEQTSNKGWSGNYDSLREKVYEKHDCYIYTEDDNVFSPNFLEYMDCCLTKFEHDEDILAVTGYSYPIDWKDTKHNVMKISSYFAAWGFGIWRSKEEQMRKAINIDNFEQQMKNRNSMRKLYRASKNQYCNFMKGMIEYTDMLVVDGEVLAIDLSFALYQMFYNKYMIFPTVSKVRNTGYGVDGIHCGEMVLQETRETNHRNYLYDKQPIDISERFEEIIMNSKDETSKLNECMENFFVVSNREIIAARVVEIFCRFFGKKSVVNLLRKMRKAK